MKLKIILLILLTTLLLVPTHSVLAAEARIQDVVVTNSSTDLLLYLKVLDAFSPEILSGVNNGLPLTFSYQISLEMLRSGWFNKEIYSGSVDYTLVYDSLKKEYSVLGLTKENKFTTTDLAEAQRHMVNLNGISIVPLTSLEPDRQYILKVRVVLDKKSLPFNFNYLIPFSFWNLETDWYSVDFRY